MTTARAVVNLAAALVTELAGDRIRCWGAQAISQPVGRWGWLARFRCWPL